MDSKKSADSFKSATLAEPLKPFTTAKGQKNAIETHQQTQRVLAQARGYFRKVEEKNQPSPNLDYTPKGMPAGEQAKQNRVIQAHQKLLRRLNRIEQARDKRLGRIEAQQDLEIRVKQTMGGRSLSQEFGLRR